MPIYLAKWDSRNAVTLVHANNAQHAFYVLDAAHDGKAILKELTEPFHVEFVPRNIPLHDPSIQDFSEADEDQSRKEYAEKHAERVMSTCYLPLLSSGKYSDVTFVVEGRELKAHRFVLAGQSLYFERMFDSEMKEAQTGVVPVPGTSYDAFHYLLKLMYGGLSDQMLPGLKLAHLMLEVFQLSEMYELNDIRKFCARRLGDFVVCHTGPPLFSTVHFLAETWRFAKTIHDENLERVSLLAVLHMPSSRREAESEQNNWRAVARLMAERLMGALDGEGRAISTGPVEESTPEKEPVECSNAECGEVLSEPPGLFPHRPCQMCYDVMYCSDDCRLRAWDGHRDECQVYRWYEISIAEQLDRAVVDHPQEEIRNHIQSISERDKKRKAAELEPPERRDARFFTPDDIAIAQASIASDPPQTQGSDSSAHTRHPVPPLPTLPVDQAAVRSLLQAALVLKEKARAPPVAATGEPGPEPPPASATASDASQAPESATHGRADGESMSRVEGCSARFSPPLLPEQISYILDKWKVDRQSHYFKDFDVGGWSLDLTYSKSGEDYCLSHEIMKFAFPSLHRIIERGLDHGDDDITPDDIEGAMLMDTLDEQIARNYFSGPPIVEQDDDLPFDHRRGTNRPGDPEFDEMERVKASMVNE